MLLQNLWGKSRAGNSRETRLEEEYVSFHFQSDKHFDLYHTHHLGSFGKCSLISAGSSAKSTWGFPSKMPFNFSSQFTTFLLFGSCSIKERTHLLFSLFNIHIKQHMKIKAKLHEWSYLNLKFQTCNLSVFSCQSSPLCLKLSTMLDQTPFFIYAYYQKSYLTIQKVNYIFNSSR